MSGRAALAAVRRRAHEARQRFRPLWQQPLVRVARVWRLALRRTLVIGITGSCGKTTAKDLTAAVLGGRLRGTRTRDTCNSPYNVARTLFRTFPWHDFAVVEVGAWAPDTLGRATPVLRPRVAVVTNVGPDHRKGFRSLEATAAEKGRLVAAVPSDGVAVLNADDPLVLAMRARCAGGVLTFGLSEGADVRASDVRSLWPERLSFTLHAAGAAVRVRTRLCGEHWTGCALAAIAVGIAAGIPPAEAAAALAEVEPATGRMSPVELEDGVVFVRDDWKAPVWSIPPALAFLRAARATRKLAVIGTLSDYPGSNEKRYAAVARQALEAADHVVFVGRWARGALRADPVGRTGALLTFERVEEAAAHLREFLEPGDLVLLKGSLTVDRLERIVEARAAAASVVRPRRVPTRLPETAPRAAAAETLRGGSPST